MNSYNNHIHVSLSGLFSLFLGSALSGIVVGALAYFISNFFYLLFIFGLFTGCAGLIIYDKLLRFSKVHHTLITILVGFVMGIWIAFAYFGIPYLVARNDFIKSVQDEYQVTAQVASDGLNSILMEETGSSGLLGFMKLRAREGEEFTHYMLANSLPVFEFSFTMKSVSAWIYWIIEALLFSLPIAIFGWDAGRRPFNLKAKDWYDSFQNQIGSVPLIERDALLSLLHKNELDAISELILPEDSLKHPTVEIYEQHSNNLKGDFLLTVKQTNNDHKPRIRRKVVGRWEINPQDYLRFSELVKQKFEKLGNPQEKYL